MQSTDGSQYWGPRQSLWSLIVEHVPESELPEVRGVLGDSLLDMYTELHSEVEMWRKIWHGIQRGGNHSNRAGTPLLRQQRSPLADPPKVKELLRAEIRMLLQSVRERAIRDGRDGDDALFRYKPDTVNYALGHPNNCPSNCSYPSDCSCPGNTDPSQHGSRPSSCCSVQSSIHDEIEAVRDKLNVTDIDQVVAHLKSVLIEECEALKSQVNHLQVRRIRWSTAKY
ncbi:coiled-coil domain-containing protein 24 [Centroberyx affinis]|uniref:coiled-coil domain-containing protein 24 n=1 Tax=Centroberyx affinis TaxID=166261 RepID=UPI003A5BF281